MNQVFVNIKGLLLASKETLTIRKGKNLSDLPQIENAFLFIKNGKIENFGSMEEIPSSNYPQVNAKGKYILPTWCDSHTHLVFAASREEEFRDKINGLSYQEIASKGGGILNSAKKLNTTPFQTLLDLAQSRLDALMALGTGAIEIKSGYGLSVEGELKMLRVIQALKEKNSIPIKATFLGAHALPLAYKNNREDYLDLIINEMLPNIHKEGLADYIDVFCEKVAFSPEETKRLIEAGDKYGLKAKIHTNQFYSLGGIEVCTQNQALSVDHLEVLNDQEIQVLSKSNTIATLLPTAPFFLNDPYPPAKKIIAADIPVALATDFNPGSSPSGNMQFVVSIACIKMKIKPEEAIQAATLNGAYAMEVEKQVGSIEKGKDANFILTKEIPSVAYIPYSFGENIIEKVFIKGEAI